MKNFNFSKKSLTFKNKNKIFKFYIHIINFSILKMYIINYNYILY